MTPTHGKWIGVVNRETRNQLKSTQTKTNHHSGEEIAGQEYPRLAKDDWPKVVPLSETVLPGLPTRQIFRGPLGDMIEEVSEATETPPELAMTFGLAAVATPTAKRFSVLVKDDYYEQLNIWTLCALPSGSRKSEVRKKMTNPLFDWEMKSVADAQAKIQRAESEAETIKCRVARLNKEASELSGGAFEVKKDEIAQLNASIQPKPALPRLIVEDITPEHLGTMLSEQGERIALISDEGGIFKLIGGRYNNGISNPDLFLKAFTGSSARVDRGSRPPVCLHHPALTMAISPQPGILRGAAKHDGFRDCGLLGRFLYMVPRSNLGERTGDTAPCSEPTKRGYAELLNNLLNIPADHNNCPRVLTLSDQAQYLWRQFERDVEAELKPDGRFGYMTDWAGKLPGLVARISGLLHCAEYVSSASYNLTIDGDTMSRAVMLGEIAIEHAIAAFEMMAADPAMEAAKALWPVIKAGRMDEFRETEAWHPLRGRKDFPMEVARPGFAVLVAHGYIREKTNPSRKSNVGRPPSPTYVVNPALMEDWF